MKFPCDAAVSRLTVHLAVCMCRIGVGACGDFVHQMRHIRPGSANLFYIFFFSHSHLFRSDFFPALLHMPTAFEYLLLLDNDLFSFLSFQRQRMRLPHRY